MRVTRPFGVVTLVTGALLAIIFIASTASSSTAALPPDTARFAIVGDYGMNNQAELDVSNLVKSWNPELVITTGDNNYPDGEASTIDPNIGQYYHQFIYPYYGSYGKGAPYNQFFPSLGNHDWDSPTGAQPYLDYFTLPGNERYYDLRWGPVHLFALDSDPREPDGILSTSAQAAWLQNRLASSSAPWKLVYLHHPPYSSGGGGSHVDLRWPYQQWGASVVVAGHTHNYERIVRNGFTYVVNGLGGAPIHTFGTPVTGSVVRYSGNYGAMLVDANNTQMTMQFQSRTGTVVDTFTLAGPTATATATATATPTATRTSTPTATPGCATGPDYLITQATGASIVPGTTYVPGSSCNSCTVSIPLPFSYSLYGTPYTSVNASNKGTLQFGSSNPSGSDTCLPTTTFNSAIFAYWDELNTNINDVKGIYTSVSGVAPDRIFNIEWRAGYVANDATANFEVRLYEGQPRFDLVYGNVTRRGFSATIGVQMGTGARYTQHACNTTNSIQPGMRLTFDQRVCPGGLNGRTALQPKR